MEKYESVVATGGYVSFPTDVLQLLVNPLPLYTTFRDFWCFRPIQPQTP